MQYINNVSDYSLCCYPCYNDYYIMWSYLHIKDEWIDPARKSDINANYDHKSNSISHNCSSENPQVCYIISAYLIQSRTQPPLYKKRMLYDQCTICKSLLRARISSPCAFEQETQQLSRALTPFPSRHSPQRVPALMSYFSLFHNMVISA